jgi:GH15 family glucan-1,4-alpha-glucosidase
MLILVHRGARPRRALDEARLAFEKMLTYANHLGLYAEQISRTGEQQGNFPRR